MFRELGDSTQTKSLINITCKFANRPFQVAITHAHTLWQHKMVCDNARPTQRNTKRCKHFADVKCKTLGKHTTKKKQKKKMRLFYVRTKGRQLLDMNAVGFRLTLQSLPLASVLPAVLDCRGLGQLFRRHVGSKTKGKTKRNERRGGGKTVSPLGEARL